MKSPVSLRCQRRGLSLLEVLVALTIFLFAFIVLGRLVIRGSDLALEMQQRSQAAQLAQTKLAEVVAGAIPLTPQTKVPFEEIPGWEWSLECENNDVPGLWRVNIHVRPSRSKGSPVEVALSQMVLDPSLRGHVLDAPLPIGADSTASSTDSTTGSTTDAGSKGGNAP
jgi:type II secretion system protein I